MNIQCLEANSDTVRAGFTSQLHEHDGFWLPGLDNLAHGQKKLLLDTLRKESILYRDGEIELRFKLLVNEKQLAHTIANLSSNNVLYDRVDSIGRDSPGPTCNPPANR